MPLTFSRNTADRPTDRPADRPTEGSALAPAAAPAASPIDGQHFRGALGAFATGVTIVTTCDEQGNDVGLTANSFNSVSLDPPMVLWSLSKHAGSLPAFQGNAHFAVHVLALDQQALSDRFAKRGADRFAGLELGRGVGGVPLLQGCSARFECRTAFQHEGGDHVIFVGEVLAFDHFEQAPLVFHGGSYADVQPRANAPAPGATAPAAGGPAETAASRPGGPSDAGHASLPDGNNRSNSGDSSSNADSSNSDELDSSFRKDYLGYLLGLASMQLHQAVRERCVELGLSDSDYHMLTLLMSRPDLSLDEVKRLLAVSGTRLAPEQLAAMLARGLIRPLAPGLSDGSSRLHLSDAGQHLAIEVFAAAKAAEAHAVRELDFDEAQLLKQLLKRVIRSHL